MSFKSDLESGNRSEETVIKFLSDSPKLLQGLLLLEQEKKRFSNYDFKIGASFEVKNDKYKSDNFCFETHNPKTEKLTGIMKSIANYIIYINDDIIVIFDREKLIIDLTIIEEIKKAKGKFRLLKRMGDGNSAGILVDKTYCLKNFKSVLFSKYFN